jgi:hypothetical protein
LSIGELTMKDVVSDLLLEHPPHPLDIWAALPFAVGSDLRFSGACGLAHERSPHWQSIASIVTTRPRDL